MRTTKVLTVLVGLALSSAAYAETYGTVGYSDCAEGRRARGDGIGTAGDSPRVGHRGLVVVSAERCDARRYSAGDAPVKYGPLASASSRTRGDGAGTAGDSPIVCARNTTRIIAGDTPLSQYPHDPAVGRRTRGDGAGSAGDAPRF